MENMNTMGKGVNYIVEGNILTMKIDLSKTFGKSASGKTTIIATSSGNTPILGREEIKIGLNIYTK